MITLVSGLPGTGKTLSAIKRFLLPALRKGRKVYSNIDGLDLLKIGLYLNPNLDFMDSENDVSDYFQTLEKIFVFTEKFTTDLLVNQVDKNSLVIIDEAQVFWNNRDYASEENKKLLPFLQKHRHYGLDIIFLTQNIDQVDIGIRRLCQVHYRLNKLSSVGMGKVIKVKVFPDAMGSEQFKPIANLAWRIDSGIFPLYKSYEGQEVSEAKAKSYNVFLRSPVFLFFVAVLFLCVFLVFKNFRSLNPANVLAGASASKKNDFSKFSLGEYDEYYCGDKFYVLRGNGKVDTLQPKDVPPSYCPHINFSFKRVSK